MTNLTPYGGRKFLLTCASAAVHVVLLWFGKMDQATYQTIFMGTVGFFLTANVVTHISEDRAKAQQPPGQQPGHGGQP